MVDVSESMTPVGLSIVEAAKRIGIGKTAFYETLKRGAGPRVTKIGSRSIIFEDDLRAWVDGLRGDRQH